MRRFAMGGCLPPSRSPRVFFIVVRALRAGRRRAAVGKKVPVPTARKYHLLQYSVRILTKLVKIVFGYMGKSL